MFDANQGPHSDFTGPNMGCTACVAVIQGKQLIVANAGDSRCVISRKGRVPSLPLTVLYCYYYFSSFLISNIHAILSTEFKDVGAWCI